MINGSDLRDFYIQAWRAIPDLVDAMGGDEGAIRGAIGVASISKSLQREVETMPAPSIFVAYQGFTKGDVRRAEVTKHLIVAFIRAATPSDDSNIQFGALMVDGVPDGSDLPVRYMEPDVNADPMDMPRFERVSSSQLPFDIWRLSFAVSEHAG